MYSQNHTIEILDCTIRDGSYVVNFDWPLEKVVGIVRDLAANNCKYIEIGHGLGLGAERTYPHGPVSDEDSLKEAVKVKGNSLLGAFFIPGIGTMKDIDRFKENGGDFLRIGTNISESKKAEAYIRHAKELGLIVSYNAMKSYVAKPFEFCKRMTEAASWGADMLYFVDSAAACFRKKSDDMFLFCASAWEMMSRSDFTDIIISCLPMLPLLPLLITVHP